MTRHNCARCGKPDRVERQVYSRFTGSRYCRDMNACDKRFAKLKRKRERERAEAVA